MRIFARVAWVGGLLLLLASVVPASAAITYRFDAFDLFDLLDPLSTPPNAGGTVTLTGTPDFSADIAYANAGVQVAFDAAYDFLNGLTFGFSYTESTKTIVVSAGAAGFDQPSDFVLTFVRDPLAFTNFDYATSAALAGTTNGRVTLVPEPMSLALFGGALAGLGLVARRRRIAAA